MTGLTALRITSAPGEENGYGVDLIQVCLRVTLKNNSIVCASPFQLIVVLLVQVCLQAAQLQPIMPHGRMLHCWLDAVRRLQHHHTPLSG